jgi:two-component system phosphate regulon sensor histidine kinase PhoR
LKFGLKNKLFLISFGLVLMSVIVTYLYVGSRFAAGAGSSQSSSTLAVAILFALLVSILLSSIAADLMVHSARPLTHMARRLAQGDLEVRARPVGHDEFAELGLALDKTAESLTATLAELRRERDMLRGILNGMQEGVLVLDRNGRIVLTNPALREMLLLGSDAVGKTLLEVIRHAELKETVNAATNSEEPVQKELELGGLRPRSVLVRVARFSGSQKGVFAVFVDVTQMRRLESMRRDFVANASHELRTPIAAIRSAAETLKGAAASDSHAVDQFLPMIERNAQRLQALVEDLLELSRIESRQFRLELENIQAVDELEHVVELFAERAAQKSIELRVEVREPLWALADRRALEHVLSNLVDNAVKYCGPDTVVKLCAVLRTDRIELSVEDTGPGIEAVHLPRLFERFYRVDAGRSRAVGGTGLGLSIVKHLIETMGGAVSVESEVGRGTTFRIELQRGKDPSTKLQTRAAEADAKRAMA